MPDDSTAEPIERIAAALGLQDGQFEAFGSGAAKLKPGLERELSARPLARYVNVSAVSPTPAGEGKTVTTIGLAMALCKLGHPAVATLREPSMGPVFGIKGGGAGGGRATLVPADSINLHFTGDIHAIASANNLLAALIDNHLKRGQSPVVDPTTVTWRRCVDMNDRGLDHIITGLDHVPQAPLRETGFDLAAASEVMAIVALANSFEDLRRRLGRILVGLSEQGEAVFAEDLGAAGAMAALLRDAVRPNLVQTCEQTPALVHAGPFANIAHGNSSILADLNAVRLADFVVTESGFGADCGAEKFFHIKCRVSGLVPRVEVLVCTVRALKMQSGRIPVRAGRPLPADLKTENLELLRAGAVNLQAHLDILRKFGVPVVVAVNRFPSDTQRELDEVARIAASSGAVATAVSDVFASGSGGGMELAAAVVEASNQPSRLTFQYSLDASLEEKIETVATQIYGAAGVDYHPAAKRRLEQFSGLGFSQLPICIAKTQYSISHDPTRLGRPQGFRLPIRDVRLASGAGFVYALAGEIRTMPGLPASPAACRIDVDAAGNITGLT